MKHEKFNEMMQLSIYGELTHDKEIELQNHLLECEECNTEYAGLRQLYSALAENRPAEPGERILNASRNDLLRNIRQIERKPSTTEFISGWLKDKLFTGYGFAFGGVFTLLIGMFAGYLIFNQQRDIRELAQQTKMIELDNLDNENLQIANVRFPDRFNTDGEIEIQFDAVKPVTYKGNVNDEMTKRILAAALVSTSNPGVKLRTISTIASQTENNNSFDPKVKRSLIETVKTDENPGVRREALNLLMRYPPDELSRDAYLYVLSNDNNSGNRILAINALSTLHFEQNKLDEKTRSILNNMAETDDNDFIKIRAASLLKEVDLQ
ncbi:MAG: HEAT repeat domain-containing protein [Melioribacteraceae bacterium]|nr:HEAT repeat domain-containing protein [Melioribacteraceae bacterium]MCF8356792.1 HEAT repeat domain-containing protein [Melioribacteraceae bacterium]MCF8396172.1 HEAT repeat domain-containing protein [Melioribacteraceae bacterium]MCF8421131.1 HEAT repeat domain-containing protein [Melioribacteraceae bacterium]